MPRLERDVEGPPPAETPPAPSGPLHALSPTDEPVRLAAAVQALLSAALGLLAAFDVWDPTQEQIAAIFLVYSALVPVIAVLVNRSVKAGS